MAKMEKRTQVNVWYFVIAMFAILAVQHFWTQAQTVEQITYSEFQRDLEQGNIKDVAVSDKYIRGSYAAPKNGKTEFVTTRVEPGIADALKKSGVSYRGIVESTFLRDLLSWILPVLFFVGVWYFLIRRMAERSGGLGGFMSVGKSKAKVYMETDTKVTFKDVAGVDEAQAELVEIVEFLKNPAQYGKLGARIPKGILLVGPPGTGKTLLARAVAGEAGVPFFSINGSEFVEMFVGVGAARVRDLFEQARAKAPAIIFIDELDALGRARGAFPGVGGHDEREQTLQQLLSELDGFDPREGVVLLAATNRPEILDPALLRAGRFDRQVLVDRPDKEGRIQILKVHMRKITMAPEVDPATIAGLTTGFTGADLANLVNEAALFATRRRAATVTLDDFTQAIERIIAGLEKRNRLLNPKERRIVAYHEMGHALVALALPGSDVIHKVSIIPRGIGSLGYTIQRPTDERYLMTREELENKIAVLLGGRAAEKVVFGELSTGAADDLAKVTDIARSMAARFGMDERLGYVAYDADRAGFLGQPSPLPYNERRFSEETAREIDTAVRETIGLAFDKAVKILTENREVLERAAKRLLAEETLDEAAIRDLTKDLRGARTAAEPSAALAG